MFFSFFKWFQDEISYLSPMQFDWFFIFSDPKIPKIPGKKKPGVMPATHWTKVSSRKLQKSISRLAARHFNNSCLDQWIFCGCFSGKKKHWFCFEKQFVFFAMFFVEDWTSTSLPNKKMPRKYRPRIIYTSNRSHPFYSRKHGIHSKGPKKGSKHST